MVVACRRHCQNNIKLLVTIQYNALTITATATATATAAAQHSTTQKHCNAMALQ